MRGKEGERVSHRIYFFGREPGYYLEKKQKIVGRGRSGKRAIEL